MIRTAISPRLATNTFLNILFCSDNEGHFCFRNFLVANEGLAITNPGVLTQFDDVYLETKHVTRYYLLTEFYLVQAT